MLKPMVSAWFAGLGLVAAALAAQPSPKPSEAEIKAAQKKMQSATGVVGSLTRKLYKQDKELAALKDKRDQARKAVQEAIRKAVAKMPDAAELLKNEADITKEMDKLAKEMAQLRRKQRDVQRQLNAKARKDPAVVAARRASGEADTAATSAARAKLATTPEGKKALDAMAAARKAYYALKAPAKRARGKRAGSRKPGRKKPKVAPAKQ